MRGQISTLQASLTFRAPQALPPCLGCRLTPRMRVRVPEPQVLSQGVHELHVCSTQSTGQACGLHNSVSEFVEGHDTPPCAAARSVVRARVRVPPPHVVLHSSQEPQSDILQSTGQCCALHCFVSVSTLQALPP